MKKLAKLLCLLLIGSLLLTGCDLGFLQDAVEAAQDDVKEKTFTDGGVTIKLTSKFLNFTDTATNTEKYDFLYASDAHAVFGIKENKAELTATFGELDAQSYGDLIASLIKRHYSIKDYGWVFPGHGGVLDRFDSIIATAAFLFILVSSSDFFAVFF